METQAPNSQNNYREDKNRPYSNGRVYVSKAQDAIANVFAKDFSAFAKPYNQRLDHLRFKYHYKNSKSGAACDLA
ncbi:hypothetical protein TorRG33x02_286770 [Trema orientale]|uniref:Uncharacterized protein n=1 Tax=Trema orientale TaxID=63057 RepID=A0A2P5CFU9_TREOI|nr:hypothetical protein TorRG33x02_286770 [Trema orientale]